jgi:hypothetical protein
MLGMVPHMPSHLIPRSIAVYNKASESLEHWPISQVEERLKVTFCALPKCGHKYIEELMFSGFSIGDKDLEFRYHSLACLAFATGDLTTPHFQTTRSYPVPGRSTSRRSSRARGTRISSWPRSTSVWVTVSLRGRTTSPATTSAVTAAA